VTKIYNKFLRTGSVADAPRIDQFVTVTTPENMEMVALTIAEYGNQSARRLSMQVTFQIGRY
jgi:hypothetical protein